jgi:hypothetical protein
VFPVFGADRRLCIKSGRCLPYYCVKMFELNSFDQGRRHTSGDQEGFFKQRVVPAVGPSQPRLCSLRSWETVRSALMESTRVGALRV